MSSLNKGKASQHLRNTSNDVLRMMNLLMTDFPAAERRSASIKGDTHVESRDVNFSRRVDDREIDGRLLSGASEDIVGTKGEEGVSDGVGIGGGDFGRIVDLGAEDRVGARRVDEVAHDGVEEPLR